MAAPATQGDAHGPAVKPSPRGAHDRRSFILGLAAIAAVAALPTLPFVNDYLLAVAVRALIFIALGQAWNVVAGIGGLLSLGHGVFLGLGCYATGILFNMYGLPPWLGVWVGAVLSLAIALVMGAMTLRMRGVFFALATIAVSLALDQLARHYVDLTGGDNGLALKFLGNSLWFMQSRTPGPFVYAGLVFVVAYYWITRWILASRFGLEMRAVRDDEEAAAAAGVPVFRTKLLGLLVSAVMTSVAGTLYMQFYQAIDPETAFGLSQAIQLQLPALIGGLGTSWGPVVGGTVMILLSESTNWGSTRLGVAGVDILVYGLMLLIVVMYAPKGIMGLFATRRRGGSG
jgi:branched-chain amino acid transport system permease protein